MEQVESGSNTMPTLKDIANLAGVSNATVSIVLNGHANERKISIGTQEKVLKAAHELKYTPNVAAKTLKMSRKVRYSIGVYWPVDFRSAYLGRTLSGIKRGIDSLGMEMDILVCPYQNDMLHLDEKLKDGAVYHGAIIAEPSKDDMEYLESIVLPMPVVMLNRKSNKYYTVGVDDYQMGAMAAKHFASRGLKKVGAIFAKYPYEGLATRNQGFIETCEELGIELDDNSTIYTKNMIKNGSDGCNELLERKTGIRGIFCDSDALAIGALSTLSKANIPVPDEIQVIAIGLENDEVGKFTIPPLTTIELPAEDMTENSLTLLVKVLKHEITDHRQYILEPKLHIRDSCP